LLQSAARFSLRPTAALQHRAALLLEADPQAAEALVLRAVALDPSASGWLLAGNAAMRCHRPSSAVVAFLEAVRLNPRLFAGHFNLAHAYAACGNALAARRHAQRARSLRPGDPRLGSLPR
jgi:tetratricopeptide (TPR) repeat protein